jgi:hypothetical protein
MAYAPLVEAFFFWSGNCRKKKRQNHGDGLRIQMNAKKSVDAQKKRDIKNNEDKTRQETDQIARQMLHMLRLPGHIYGKNANNNLFRRKCGRNSTPAALTNAAGVTELRFVRAMNAFDTYLWGKNLREIGELNDR